MQISRRMNECDNGDELLKLDYGNLTWTCCDGTRVFNCGTVVAYLELHLFILQHPSSRDII